MSADNMPPPSSVLAFAEAMNGQPGELDAWLECNSESEVRAHVRAYAAEQTRELVEALEECVEDSQAAVDTYVMNYGENWRPSRLAGLRAYVASVRALIAKHKEQP